MWRRFFGKVGKLARVEPFLPLNPGRQQLAPTRVKAMVQLGDEAERAVGQNVGRAAEG